MSLIKLKHKYNITDYISAGSFGKIFLAYGLNGKKVCLKTEPKNNKHKNELLRKEFNIYNIITKYYISPMMYEILETDNYNILVLDKGGSNLENIMCSLDKNVDTYKIYQNEGFFHFNLKQTIILTYGLLNIIKWLHLNNILYKDIKPQNFILNCPIEKLTIRNVRYYLKIIDFGLSEILTPERLAEKEKIKITEKGNFTGTKRYVSISTYYGYKQWFKDDMESLMYLIIYFYNGYLPWQSHLKTIVNKSNYKNMNDLIKEVKLPNVYSDIWNEINKVNTNSHMNYDKIIFMILKYYIKNYSEIDEGNKVYSNGSNLFLINDIEKIKKIKLGEIYNGMKKYYKYEVLEYCDETDNVRIYSNKNYKIALNEVILLGRKYYQIDLIQYGNYTIHENYNIDWIEYE